MRLRTHLAIAALILLGAVVTAHAADPPEAGRISVLFLGDKGIHHPADRYAQIAPVLAGRGIEVAYTENLSDLNPETLGKYDALLIYANTTKIGKNQERHSSITWPTEAASSLCTALRSASCNSPEYIALVGAQFQQHGTGEFETKVVDPDHPIMQGA